MHFGQVCYILPHLFQTRVKILPVPWKDLIQQAKTAAGDWVGWTSPAFWSAFLPPLLLFYVATPLSLQRPFLRQLHFLPASGAEWRRGSGRSGSSSNSSDSSSGGSGSRLRAIIPWAFSELGVGSSRGGLSCSGADRGAEAPSSLTPQFTLSPAAI